MHAPPDWCPLSMTGLNRKDWPHVPCPALLRRHVPEHWQQQLQALQETPFHGGMPAAAGAGPVVMPAPQAPFRMARASSAGMEALAEAAAAALAAQPKPQLGCSTAGPTPAQQPTGAGDPEVGACAEDGAGAVRPAPHKKRTREQRAAQAELGPQQQKPAASKRPCAGVWPGALVLLVLAAASKGEHS